MRVLLDTNVVIHRETHRIMRNDIGKLFYWLDRLNYEKCIHPQSIDEIDGFYDAQAVATMKTKLHNYSVLKTTAPEIPAIQKIRPQDKDQNDTIDTNILRELAADRVDILITEDRKMHHKARMLKIADRTFTIEQFLEKVVAENPELTDYKVLAVKQAHFGDLNLQDPFFDSFREDYIGFDTWFNKKSDEVAYVCLDEHQAVVAFLYIKVEDASENYRDINPSLAPAKRLKIGTFKIIFNGHKLGERFLKIIFDNALQQRVEEIYVTIFNKNPEQERLSELLQDWGFTHHGVKRSKSGEEQVYVRDFRPAFNQDDPQYTYPYLSQKQRKFIVPIYPDYHTELLPDSILRTEKIENYLDSKANRNALSKVYISRSIERNLRSGDIIVFYRTKYNGPAYYTSVATTLGVVQQVITNIRSEEEFIRLCRKRSVFSDTELAKYWNYNPRSRPFIVNFAYLYSFKKRLNLKELQELGILVEAPRGFEALSDEAFATLLEHSDGNQRFIID